MDMRTPLARARGLGPAKHGGTGHWWAQRLSSLALAPLMLWFVVAVLGLVGADHAAFAAWLAVPGNMLMMALCIVALFIHINQGMQVVVEDYVHGEGGKLAALLAVKGFSAFGGAACLLALFRVAYGS